MKILMINDIGSEMGGAEIVIMQLKKLLTDRGHSVRLLSGNEYTQKRRINDYEFKSFANDSWKRFFLYIYNPFAYVALKKVLKEYQPDIVHLHNVSKASASILFTLKEYPTVMTAHDFECIDQTAFSKLKSLQPFKESYKSYFKLNKNISYYIQKLRFFIIRQGQKNIDLFIAPSQAMATTLQESMPTAHVTVVYNGKEKIKKTIFVKYNKQPKKILFVGRLVVEKGARILVESMKKVLKSYPQAELTIVGEGPEATALKELVHKYKLDNSIYFPGAVSQKEIEHYYEETDIVVVPSIWYEPFGIVAVEAMLHGKPVIASNTGGLAELVDNEKNGLLIKPGSSAQLASSISLLLTDPKKIEAMGRSSLKKVADFSAVRFIDHMNAIYGDLVEYYR